MKKYVVLKTSVLNRSSRNNSIIEESSEQLASFFSRSEAEYYVSQLSLPLQFGNSDIYKEIIEVDDDFQE